MLIRPATPADIVSMRALEQQADTAAHWAEREYDALFAPDAPKRIALVAAEPAEVLAGFLIARCAVDEWEIENVVVAAPLRRHRDWPCAGGRTAVAGPGKPYDGRPARGSRVQPTPPARLYEKTGFSEVGRRTAYYQNPSEDALLLKYSVSFP